MRAAFLVLSAILLSACGQTGSLYLPDASVDTPVEIRGPAAPAPAQPEDEAKKDEKRAQPPEP
jgi:predicted small lipoprotein YifL